MRLPLGNAAGFFSVERFYAASKSQGLAISKDTVRQFVAHLERCFLVRTVWVEAVAVAQQRRLAKLASASLMTHKLGECSALFDVIAVHSTSDGRVAQIEYIPEALRGMP